MEKGAAANDAAVVAHVLAVAEKILKGEIDRNATATRWDTFPVSDHPDVIAAQSAVKIIREQMVPSAATDPATRCLQTMVKVASAKAEMEHSKFTYKQAQGLLTSRGERNEKENLSYVTCRVSFSNHTDVLSSP